MKSIVYDFLQRKAHKKIAVEFKLQFGPFRDLDGLTLEKLFVMYKKDFNVIVSNEAEDVVAFGAIAPKPAFAIVEEIKIVKIRVVL